MLRSEYQLQKYSCHIDAVNNLGTTQEGGNRVKTKGRVAVYLQTLLAAVMLTCIFGAHTAYAELTEQEKNSSYGFFLWLSENQELSEADRTDAAVAAQLLKGTVSSNYSGQVFNNGSISAGSGEPGTDYSVVLQKTSIGAENDATTLDNVREAISLIKLGNTYRAKEDLHALNVSSSLMAMSEVNANYQFTKWGHTLAFNALENLSTKSRGSTQGFPSPEYDPYVGWYTEEKNNLETNNGGQTGHYLTLTDRKGTMFLTGFGYTYGHSVDTYNWTTAYCSQHFSDNSRHCSIGEGITPDDYLTYLRRYQCSLEGHEIDTTKVTVTKDATCLEDGLRTGPCKKCGETIEEVIPKLGHDLNKTAAKAATCTEAGNIEYYTCSRCEKFFSDEDGTTQITQAEIVVAAPGHQWADEYTVDKEATCTEAGSESKHCTRCGESNPESVRTIEKLPHSYGAWTTTKEATCTEAGSKELVCSACGYKITDTIKALGHQWADEYTVDEEPTCQKEGSESKHCSVCGVQDESTVRAIPAGDNHTWSDWKVVTPATTSSKGTKTRTCSVCGKEETQEIPKQAEPKAADGTAVGRGASATAAEAAIISAASDEGPSGTTFVQLSAKVKKAKNTSITLSWNRVAPKYVIYGNKCGKGQKFKKLATVTGTSFTQNGLVKGTYYKYMVVAVDAGGRVVAASKTMHAVTSGKKAGNPKKVTVKKKTLNLKPGKKAKIKASIVKPSGKKVKNHRKLSYESMNPKVATVAKNGSVKAVAKGTTYIYVYAQNGVYAKVKVKVK